jgi:aldehyde:ferredoxin oxidoreductase
VKFAAIVNDGTHSASRCGGGAVMGSKNLKAIVARGTGSITISDPEGLLSYVRTIHKQMKDNPDFQNYRKRMRYGTIGFLEHTNLSGAFPTRHHQDVMFEAADRIGEKALLEKMTVRNRGCFNCPLACNFTTTVRTGPYAGLTTGEIWIETAWAFGAECGNDSIEVVAKANDLCERLGLDVISTGVSIAFAMELFEKGIITEKEIDQGNLRFGNSDEMIRLIEKIARREGFGDVLAEGVKRAAEKIGKNAEKYALHVKGLELPCYDPRSLKGYGLSLAVATRGACHMRGTVFVHELGRAGSEEKMNRLEIKSKAKLVKELEDRGAIFDSFLLCRFMRRIYQWSELARMLSLVTGRNFTVQDIKSTAERIINTSRAFSVREGISRMDDMLPRRFMEDPTPQGPAKGALMKDEELNFMLNEYYRLRGWDREGCPL